MIDPDVVFAFMLIGLLGVSLVVCGIGLMVSAWRASPARLRRRRRHVRR
jgi:cytochrome c biogenesis protein ResB